MDPEETLPDYMARIERDNQAFTAWLLREIPNGANTETSRLVAMAWIAGQRHGETTPPAPPRTTGPAAEQLHTTAILAAILTGAIVGAWLVLVSIAGAGRCHS